MVDELVELQRKSFLSDLNTIMVQEGNEFGFGFSVVFDTEQEAKAVFNRIPKSYKVRLTTLGYPYLNIRKSFMNVSISFVPNESTGKVNEAGRIRAKKIKEKLKELLPHYRVITTIYVPEPGFRSFKRHTIFEGWA